MDLLEKALDENSREYTLLKLAEECTEVAELCIKKITKKGGIKEPSDEMLVLEMADLLVRFAPAAKIVDPDRESIGDAMNNKLMHLFERIEKYKGTL